MTSAHDEEGRGSASVSVVEVDSDGNLILRAGAQLSGSKGSPRSFRVCASTMRRSSPVWKCMLFGPFKESNPVSETWSVDLPEDDADALEVLLNIVHANFPLVPHRPCLLLLRSILRLANKYDMMTALRPWAEAWLRFAWGFSGEKSGRVMFALASVARELGQMHLETYTMQQLVFEATVDKNGRIVTGDGSRLVDDGSDLCKESRDLRQYMLKALPERLNAIISALTIGPARCVFKCDDFKRDDIMLFVPKQGKTSHVTAVKSQCNNVILGSIFKAMARARGAVSLKLVANAGESVAQLSDSIRVIVGDITALSGHRECNPKKEVLASLEVILEGQWKQPNKTKVEEMTKRREELGLAMRTGSFELYPSNFGPLPHTMSTGKKNLSWW